MHTKNEQLIYKLIEKSERGDIRWLLTDVPNQYVVNISNRSLKITRTTNMGATRVRFDIEDQNGKLVDSISRVVFGTGMNAEGELMASLYESVRRNAHKINEAIDEILSALD